MAKQHALDGIFTRAALNASPATIRSELSRALWLLIAAMVAAAAVGFSLLHLRIDPRSNPRLIGIALAYAAVTWFYTYARRDPMVSKAMLVVGQLFVVLFVGLLLTYAASAAAFPYCDAELYALDRWIGFDRQTYRALIEGIPGLATVLDTAYLSIQPQIALVPFVLIVGRELPRLQRFVLAFGLALSATALISLFVPAMDAFIYVDLAPLRQAAIPPGVYSHLVTLEALRSGAMSVIRLNDLEGLLTFPSFHTASAILFAWALWKVRYVRAIGLVVNVLMILSTPITGQHYLVDVIAGGVVALVAIVLAKRVAGEIRSEGTASAPATSPQACR